MSDESELAEGIKKQLIAYAQKTDFIKAQLKYPKVNEFKKIIIRPIDIKSGKKIQFSFFTQTQDVTKNFDYNNLTEPFKKAFETYPKSIYIQLADRAFQYTHKKGKFKYFVHHSTPTPTRAVKHDKRKKYVIDFENKDDAKFLTKLGIIYLNNIMPREMKKYIQINRFLDIVDSTLKKAKLPKDILVVDFGCGNSELTFAIYHYLTVKRGLSPQIIGIDKNEKLVEKVRKKAARFGYKTEFIAQKIAEFKSGRDIDIVISLHACDTATDDALAQAIKNNAKFIFCAPCCHYNLHQRIKNSGQIPEAIKLIAQDGITLNRQIDLLTDTLRAQLLRINDYQTEIIEFVDKEHSDKNLMIKAVKKNAKSQPGKFSSDYETFIKEWNITPYLEELLKI